LRNPGELSAYLKLLIINIIFGLIWCFGETIIVGFSVEPIRTFIIFFIIPLCVLFFIRAKENNIVTTIYFIGIIVSISCIIQFIIINIFPGSAEPLTLGRELLRGPLTSIIPSSDRILFSHIGSIYKAHGITGSYHDSANILAMVSVFSIGNVFNKKSSIFSILLTFVFLLGLLSTLSLANIVAAIVGILIITLFSYGGLFKRISIIAVIVFSLLFLATRQIEENQYDEVFNNFDPSGEKIETMLNLGSSSILERSISIMFGHEHLTRFSDMGNSTEASIVTLLVNFGLFTMIPLILILCYPIYIFLISKKEIKREMWVPIVTVCTGLLTLLHYGSLFRSTSIFLFFAFYSMVIKKYLNGRLQYIN